MNKEVSVDKTVLDGVEVSETVSSRLHRLEERLEGFDKDKFVEKTLVSALEEKEEQENLLLSWGLTPVYSEEPSL